MRGAVLEDSKIPILLPIEIEVVDRAVGVLWMKSALVYSTSPQALDSALANAAGAFRLKVRELGSYAIEIIGDGFQDLRHPVSGGIEVLESAFDSGSDFKIAPVAVTLARSGQLVGSVRDAETTHPIGSLTVLAMKSRWSRGKRIVEQQFIAFTDEEGKFQFDSVGSDAGSERNLLARIP